MAGELDPARALADLRALRRLTGDERGAQRVAWTDTWARARDWLRGCRVGRPAGGEVETGEACHLCASLRRGRALGAGGIPSSSLELTSFPFPTAVGRTDLSAFPADSS